MSLQTGTYEHHPIANLFPLMADPELEKLRKSIREHGQRDDIVLLEGKVLDGRNRYSACLMEGIPAKVRAFGSVSSDGESPTAFVMDHNATRRHLKPSQLAAIAAEATPFYEAEAKARQTAGLKKGSSATGELTPGESIVNAIHEAAEPNFKPEPAPAPQSPDDLNQDPGYDVENESQELKKSPPARKPRKAAAEAAASVGVSTSLVEKAKRLQEENPDKFAEVKAGTTTVSAASGETARKAKAKADAEAALENAYQRIENVCGKSLAAAARDGTRLKGRKEVMAYAALADDDMIKIRGLIDDGKTVAWAVKYKAKSLSRTNTIGDLLNRAAAMQGVFTLDIEGWLLSAQRKLAGPTPSAEK